MPLSWLNTSFVSFALPTEKSPRITTSSLGRTVEYAASFGPLEEPDFRQKISNTLYGELSVEIGYCCGHNKVLNALEYHRSAEANVAATDVILLLGQQSDITDDFKYDTAQLEAFFVPAGTAVELYATTLHYTPIGTKENDYAFKTGVILPFGTNFPLGVKLGAEAEEEKLPEEKLPVSYTHLTLPTKA